MNELLNFDSMVTPKFISVFYWLLLVFVLLSGLGVMFTGSVLAGLLGIVIGAIGVRVWCELLIVMFKIHENIKKIAERTDSGAL